MARISVRSGSLERSVAGRIPLSHCRLPHRCELARTLPRIDKLGVTGSSPVPPIEKPCIRAFCCSAGDYGRAVARMRRERERNHPSESSSLAWRGSEYRHKIPRNESLGWGDGGTRRAIRKRALRGAPGGLVGGQLFELITLRKSRVHAIDTGAPHTRARKLASRRDGRTRAEQHEPTQFAGAHVTLLAAVRGAIVQLRRPRSTLALSSPAVTQCPRAAHGLESGH